MKKAPYVTRPDIVPIEFGPDSQWPGASVRCRRKAKLKRVLRIRRGLLAVKDVFEASESADADGEDEGEPDQFEPDEETRDLYEETVRDFAALALHSWNLAAPELDEDGDPRLDEDGNPVTRPIPADAEGLLTQGPIFVLNLIGAWLGQALGIDPNFVPPSSSTSTSAASSDPMEAELASLQS